MISDFKAGTKVCQAVFCVVQKLVIRLMAWCLRCGLLEDNSGKSRLLFLKLAL